MADLYDIDLLTGVAETAGALALSYFGKDPRSWPKGETSIVSEADIEVDRHIAKDLLAARPDYGWLSEETADNADRLSRRRVFVIDPIDGTRAFLAGEKEWTISLAIVEEGRPVAGVLFAPALDLMFRAVRGEGAWCNGALMRSSQRSEISGARVAGSRRFVKEAGEQGVSLDYRGFVPSLAYRLALVGSNVIDAAVARPGAYDWDLAAADLLVHEAGGLMIDGEGQPLRYNSPASRHLALVAAAPDLAGPMAALLSAVEAGRPHPGSGFGDGLVG